MKARTLVPFILLVAMLATAACGGPATPTTQPAPTAEPAGAAATLEPTPARPSEAAPEGAAAFEEAPCPMALPAGAVEGKQIVCGYVTVPETRAEPEGPTIRLAVAVVPASGDDPVRDPLFMLAGGPGESALTSFVQILASPGMGAFWEGRDIVLVEQRGTRYSTPFLQCEEMSALKLELLGQNLGGAVGPGLAAMKNVTHLHMQPLQIAGHPFQVPAAFFRQIPLRVLFLAFGFGMLDQIKHHTPPPQLRDIWGRV